MCITLNVCTCTYERKEKHPQYKHKHTQLYPQYCVLLASHSIIQFCVLLATHITSWFPEDITDTSSCPHSLFEGGDDAHEQSVTAGLHEHWPLIFTERAIIICEGGWGQGGGWGGGGGGGGGWGGGGGRGGEKRLCVVVDISTFALFPGSPNTHTWYIVLTLLLKNGTINNHTCSNILSSSYCHRLPNT